MRPTIDEMLGAVRWTIESALLPEITGPYAQFQALIALDLLDLIGRHWATAIADATADVRDYRTALATIQEEWPELAGLIDRDRLTAALAAPQPAEPAPLAELTERADELASLALTLLNRLSDLPDPAARAAETALRAASLAQSRRLNERQAGLAIRR